MATDIGVKATGDRRAIERIAAKRHTTASAVVKKSVRGCVVFLAVARYIAPT